jgi:hypothetical protein
MFVILNCICSHTLDGGASRITGELLLSTVQDDESDAGVVLGLSGQRHRGLPIRHHNGAADVFHITTGNTHFCRSAHC